jgi:hypothetical protein
MGLRLGTSQDIGMILSPPPKTTAANCCKSPLGIANDTASGYHPTYSNEYLRRAALSVAKGKSDAAYT